MSRMEEVSSSRVPWWALVLCLAVSLVGVIDRDLWTPDEPRDAAMSLEMSRIGDFIVPHLAGRPFVEKPPLYFAVAAGFVKILGPVVGNIGAIRLSTAFWGLGTLAMTFLLARRLFGRDCAILAAALLATMVGFVQNLHWIRVDAALIFFVAAALWSFAEMYVGNRRWFCVPAGLFTAGAFLAKGAIGPILVGIGWIGLIIPWLINQRREDKKLDLFVSYHALCLLAFLVPALAWMILFKLKGGPVLWHEWFWENHFGRLMGTATVLGHMRKGAPLYYVTNGLVYCLPWSLIVIAWSGRALATLKKKEDGDFAARTFLLVWAIGSVIALTMSVTKRDIYLAPVLPAFALMCADLLREKLPVWCKAFLWFWVGLCVVILVALAGSALVGHFVPDKVPGKMSPFLCSFTWRHAIAVAGVLLCVYILTHGKRLGFVIQAIAITAIAYIGIFSVGGKALDLEKGMKDDFVAFGSNAPDATRNRIAGWNFSETESACLYVYCNWTVPQISDKKRLFKIVAGDDPEFDKVVIAREPSLPDLLKVPYRIVTTASPGNRLHKRTIYLVEGVKQSETTEPQ